MKRPKYLNTKLKKLFNEYALYYNKTMKTKTNDDLLLLTEFSHKFILELVGSAERQAKQTLMSEDELINAKSYYGKGK